MQTMFVQPIPNVHTAQKGMIYAVDGIATEYRAYRLSGGVFFSLHDLDT